jgi:hypothetical protein
MITEYPVCIEIQLVPIGQPRVQIHLGQHCQQLQLTQSQKFTFDFATSRPQRIEIQHYQKCSYDKDTAVIIDSISFFGIQDPKFVWLGQYKPDYPEPWASEQKAAGVSLSPVLSNVTHLGWNGTWTLDFEVPVFTWIHRVQNLGWIYN